ncbi:MAG: (deoxy)nucleoside triphosphate pyrophosphohydrolase [Muribaculaceae bacterium]|nr:(deoxy)nucleoside triphosphate pyrophosphohydrolase [Muribaculaceae bacterium]
MEVVAAIIHDSEGRIFATQRGYGDMKGGWEFPGGKIEPGETPEEALVREIKEELDVTIAVENFIISVEWDYPKFHLTMHCYRCRIDAGSPTLCEHQAALWITKDQLNTIAWLPADKQIIHLL